MPASLQHKERMLRHLEHSELIAIADRISLRLLSDLRRGKLKRITIGTIQTALVGDGAKLSTQQRDQLEILTTKRIIVKAG